MDVKQARRLANKTKKRWGHPTQDVPKEERKFQKEKDGVVSAAESLALVDIRDRAAAGGYFCSVRAPFTGFSEDDSSRLRAELRVRLEARGFRVLEHSSFDAVDVHWGDELPQ